MQPAERQYRAGERVPGTEYVVIRLEAEGGHGALYLVRHHFLEKKVQMLKTLRSFEPSKDLVERLKREAQMLAAMDHPHIVSVTSGGLTDEKDPRPYFVMERLKGRSLAQILPEAQEGVGVDAALKVTIEICDALEYVHVRHGVVHRDIKPDNIFLHVTPRNGSVTKILDFGVAHIMDFERRYTKNNLFLGTPRYASPEQVMGEKITPQTDLYAVGLVLYELLLGHGPFDDAKTFATVATAHVHREPPGFPRTRRFPEGLEALVLSLLSKDPKDRPKSAEWLATRLRQIMRIAEVAEASGNDDIGKTDLSPVQNSLTSHRANLTEAGAPLEAASEPTMSDHDDSGPATQANLGTQQSQLPFSPTVAAVIRRDEPARPIDRAAATRSLNVEIPEARRHDTEQLAVVAPREWEPRADPGTTSPSSRGQGALVAGLSTSGSSTVVASKRGPWGVVLGIAASLAVVGTGVARYVGGSTEARTVPGASAPAPSTVVGAPQPPAVPPAPPVPSTTAEPAPTEVPIATASATRTPTATTTPTAMTTPTANSAPIPSVTSPSRGKKDDKPSQRLPSSGLE